MKDTGKKKDQAGTSRRGRKPKFGMKVKPLNVCVDTDRRQACLAAADTYGVSSSTIIRAALDALQALPKSDRTALVRSADKAA